MHQLEYRIAEDVLRMFQDYRLGVLIFSGLDNEAHPGEIEKLLRDAESSARERVRGNITDEPIVTAWRDAYRKFGAKPSEHRSSIEALLRRVTKPDTLPTINPLVDIGNIASLRYLLPAGVHPIRHEMSNVDLRLARSGDCFQAVPDQAAESVTSGEVVLADQFEVLTRRWTWRQSVNTRMQGSTERAFFNVDALGVTPDRDLEAAMHDVAQLVSQFCGGTLVQSIVLASESPEFRCALD